MASTVTPTTTKQTEWLQERIKRHKEGVARLRAEIGDPAKALNELILRTFDREALIADEPPGGRPDALGWEDDDDPNAW